MLKQFPVVKDEAIVSIAQVRTDGGTQTRSQMDEDVLEDYKEAMLLGAQFPPIALFFDSKQYWLADGFHRLEARKRAGFTTIAATIRLGSRRDALLFAVGSNATHGLRRSNEDKKRAVVLLLDDEIWQRWSVRQIAETCAVSHTFVQRLIRELKPDLLAAPRLATRGESVYEFQPRQSEKSDEMHKLEQRLNSLNAAAKYHRSRLDVIEKERAQILSKLEAARGGVVA